MTATLEKAPETTSPSIDTDISLDTIAKKVEDGKRISPEEGLFLLLSATLMLLGS